MATEVSSFLILLGIELASTFGANYGGQPEATGEIYLLTDDLLEIKSTANTFEVQDVGMVAGQLLDVDANNEYELASINLAISMKIAENGEGKAWGGFGLAVGEFHTILASLTDETWWEGVSGRVHEVVEGPTVANSRRDGNIMAMDVSVALALGPP